MIAQCFMVKLQYKNDDLILFERSSCNFEQMKIV